MKEKRVQGKGEKDGAGPLLHFVIFERLKMISN